MGRVSNRRGFQIPQRVSGPKPGERQAATVLVELQLAERNHLFRAAGRGAYSQPLLGPSQADRYTLRSCSVEDGYSSVQEPEPGVPRQISLLRQCFVPPLTAVPTTTTNHPTPDHPSWVTSTSENKNLPPLIVRTMIDRVGWVGFDC